MTAPSSSLTFADLLRHHRLAAGLTQEELALRAHLSVDAISLLERGGRRRPRKDTVKLLADALALPNEERAALAAAARQASALPSAAISPATPPNDIAILNGHAVPAPPTAPPAHQRPLLAGLRADLTVVALMSLVLLAIVGLLLPLFVPVFPWAIGLGATVLSGLVLAADALAQPARRALTSQWRGARKPVASVTGALLSLVVISTTLLITRPPILIGPQHQGYDFSYAYHAPTRKGGAVTVGLWGPIQTLAVFPGPLGPLGPFETRPSQEFYNGLWNGCVVQLPDSTLRLKGWKADQCTEVPTVQNGEEDPLGRWTIFHIDPRAVWSDGTPITAADYLFTYHLLADPNIYGGGPPLSQMRLTAPDARTVRIDWSFAYGDYLSALAGLIPLPLHALAADPLAGVYNPMTDVYDSALAQRLVASDAFNVAIPVDSGPFTVRSFDPTKGRAVLVRNPRFFSNFFHHPTALDGVTLVTVNPQWPHGPPKASSVAALAADYRQGTVDLVDELDPLYLEQLGAIPGAQVQTSPNGTWFDIEFNQRAAAPNAQANGGTSIFADPDVRKAFVEAFDRCAAVRAQLGAVNCADPNLFTDEPAIAPAPDYDPSVTLPGYNPHDAARLMDRAGYPVVDGVRRARDGQTPLHITIDVPPYAAGVPTIVQRIEQDYTRTLQIAVTMVSAPEFFMAPSFSRANSMARGDFDIVLADAGPDASAYGILDTAHIPSAQNPFGSNYLGIVDTWTVQRTQLGSETPDSDQRASVYRELTRHMAQALYVEPVFITADVVLLKPTLCNFKASPQACSNLWNIADWYVARGPTCP